MTDDFPRFLVQEKARHADNWVTVAAFYNEKRAERCKRGLLYEETEFTGYDVRVHVEFGKVTV